jgi:Family of unknown function (DUF6498)
MIKLTRSDYFLIAANLVPVVGALFFNWDAKAIFLVYCLETIIIGILNLVKMGIVTAVRKTDTWYNQGSSTKQSGLFFMFFFLIHYGLFVTVQMGLFFGASGIGDGSNITVFNFFYKWPQLITNDSIIMLAAFAISYGLKMIYDFIRSGEYKTIPMMVLMFQPYGRIFVQQFTVIVGSIFLSFGAGKIFVIVFAAVKIFFEVYVNFDHILEKAMADMKKESGEK